MNSVNQRQLDIVAAIGLAIGAVFGLAGTLVSQAPLRQALWAADGVGLIGATSLLTLKFLKRGDECVVSCVCDRGKPSLASTAAGLAGSVPSFGGGVALWAAALLLTSIPKEFATWVRLVGFLP